MTKKPAPKKATIATPAIMNDAQWRARDDMHTLKQAEQIKADSSRHKAAVTHAKQEVAAIQKVARKKV